MNQQESIAGIRREIFSLIADVAKKGLTNEVANLARLAKSCDSALETAICLDTDIGRAKEDLNNIKEKLKNQDQSTATLPSRISHPSVGAFIKHLRKTGGRERGRRARENWASKAMKNPNVKLLRLGEVTYQTGSGKVVGIAYASEDSRRPYPWWLGLPENQPHFVVLLCETESGDLFDFVFPADFVLRIWASLSRDKNHHVKLHVLRNGPNWKLKLKDGPLIDINQYCGNTGILH